MTAAVGVRLSEDILKKAEYLGKFGSEDRSTVIRKAVRIGLKALLEKNAAEEYVRGKLSLSEAASKAELTLWEMEQYLVANGYKSSFSIQDLEKELQLLK